MNPTIIEAMRAHHVRPKSEALGFTDYALRVERKVEGQPEVVAMATTSAPDLDGEVVVPAGADTSYFFQNRTIFWNHDYRTPIGSLRSAKMSESGWLCRFGFSKTAFAQEVLTMVSEGVVNGVSIGFISMEAGPPTGAEIARYGPHGRTVRRWKWLELSVTPLRCNIEAGLSLAAAKRLSPATVDLLRSANQVQKKRTIIIAS